MRAETAYNVIQALPEAEKSRLYAMLGVGSKAVAPKKKKESPVWTYEEFYEAALAVMTKKRQKNGQFLKVV